MRAFNVSDMTTVGLVLYPRFTALDIVGPFQALVDVPGLDVSFIAAEIGPVTDHTGRLTMHAARRFADVHHLDVVVVPGGFGDANLDDDDPVVKFIKKVHPTTAWTTSVCTGALFLAQAGVLDGVEATTHWASYARLEALGAKPTSTRVVRVGKVITAAGVSAGIDMGLTLVAELAGADMARAVQLAIEYDPEPPFDSGVPAKASPELFDLVVKMFEPLRHPT